MGQNIFDDLIVRGGLVGNNNQLKLFNNIHFSMYPARAFALILQKIYEDTNLDFLKELGRVMGESSANKFKTEISKISVMIDKNYQKLSNMIEISGFGKIAESIIGDRNVNIIVKDHAVIKPAKDLFGENSKICEFYGEIYAAYVRIFVGVKITKIEHVKCICRGDDCCEWSLKDGND